jgi:hypothetical protein
LEFTAIAQHFYEGRRKYLPSIVQSWRDAGSFGEIVWYNQQDRALMGIASTFNTLLGRYAAALVADTEYVFVQDDDLLVEPRTIERLLKTASDFPEKIVGVKGMNLARGTDKPYSGGQATVGACDVVLGRAWACHRQALLPGIELILKHNLQPGRSDDILFNMANRGGLAIASPEYINFDEEGVGLSHEPQHFEERDAMALRLISTGL